MSNLLIAPTFETLGVKVDESLGIIDIEGKSTLPNPIDFFKNLLELVNVYTENTNREITLNFNLSHLNTSSSKWIFYLLKNIEGKHKKNPIFIINWYYDEDDEIMQETGEVYKNLFAMPFNLISVEEE